MPTRRTREEELNTGDIVSLRSTKRRRTGPDSYVPGSPPHAPPSTPLPQALDLAKTAVVTCIDSSMNMLLWLRGMIVPGEEEEEVDEITESGGPTKATSFDCSQTLRNVSEESSLIVGEVCQSTPAPKGGGSTVVLANGHPVKCMNEPLEFFHSNGGFLSATSTPSKSTFSASPDTHQPIHRKNHRSWRALGRDRDGHKPRKYINKPHIFQQKHKEAAAHFRIQLRQELRLIAHQLHELHRKSGGKMTEEVEKESLLLYSRSLTRIDTLEAEANAGMMGSHSAIDLPSSLENQINIHSFTDLLKAKDSKTRRHSISGSDVMKQFRLVLQRANSSLKAPPPVPFTPTLDQLKLFSRRKDQVAEDLLRPKLKPPQPLTPAEEVEVDFIVKKRGTISKVAREQVSNEDLSRLRPCQWLNDEIINFYGAMILQRSEDCKENAVKGKHTFLQVHYFSTFFWPKLKDDGYDKGRLAKWTKKFDIFAKDVVLIPVNHSNAHWTGAAINFRRKRIESYDSMGTERQIVFRLLRSYLDQEHRNKKKVPFDFTDWKDHSIISPTQENGFDCGVFTCQYLQGLSRGDEDVRFSQKDMPNLRRRMIWEIGNARLHGGP